MAINTQSIVPDEGKKKIRNSIAAIVGFIAVGLVSQLFFKAPTIDELLNKAVSELNKTCPMMIDKMTRLDSASVLSNQEIQYNCTILPPENTSIDVGQLKTNMEPVIINSVKTNTELNKYRDRKVTVSYSYKDKNGAFLFKVSVPPGK